MSSASELGPLVFISDQGRVFSSDLRYYGRKRCWLPVEPPREGKGKGGRGQLRDEG